MAGVSEIAAMLKLSPARVKQLITEANVPIERGANKYISLPAESVRQLLQLRGISYKPRTITFGIEKGGTGKTTISLLFSLYATSIRGARVGIIDLDPEASATLFLAGDDFDPSKAHSLLEVFESNEQIIERMVPSRFPGIDFLPARAKMRRLSRLADSSNPKNFLRKKMTGLKDAYDILLYDVPPTFTNVISSAYLASDAVVCIVNSDVFSLESLDLTIEDIHSAAESFECAVPDIKVLRNRFQAQRRGARETAMHLSKDYAEKVLPFQIKETSAISNAINDGINPFTLRRNEALKELFSDLFDSLIQSKHGREKNNA